MYLFEEELGMSHFEFHDHEINVNPFYPLISFPDRQNKKFIMLEEKQRNSLVEYHKSEK
jgi:hypothetical protein